MPKRLGLGHAGDVDVGGRVRADAQDEVVEAEEPDAPPVLAGGAVEHAGRVDLQRGGVERGETIEEALARELVEEAGVEMVGRPRLLSIHSNHLIFPGDHVLVYRVDHWRAVKATSKGEIHAVEWFAPDALPDEITKGTRRRIEEAFATRASDPHW